VESGLPPLALLLNEPKREYSRWDMKLIKAYYFEQSYQVEGFPIWVEESPNVQFVAKSKIIRSQAVVESAQEKESKKKNPAKGKRFYAEPVVTSGGTWPRRKDWRDSQYEKISAARGETDQKRAAEAEMRAAQKASNDPEIQKIINKFSKRFGNGNAVE
jgi:hypothetical protein